MVRTAILAGLLALSPAPALASGLPIVGSFGADASIGTPGLAGHIHWQLSPFVTLRGGYNYLDFSVDDQEFDDIEYSVDLNFSQAGAYIDLHPLTNGFTVTGGLVYGTREVDLESVPVEAIEIGDQFFTAEQIGSLEGNADFGDLGFYGGIGWDNTTRGLFPVSFVARLGVIVTDSPDITLQTTGGLAETDPALRAIVDAELAQEEANLEDDLSDFRFYPVLSIGIGVGF